MIASLLQLFACTDLRLPLAEEVLASDATPSVAGLCWAPVSPARARALYRAGETRGEHVRLDWTIEGAPGLDDESLRRRARVAALLGGLNWRGAVGKRFDRIVHINIQDLRALRWALLRRLRMSGGGDTAPGALGRGFPRGARLHAPRS